MTMMMMACRGYRYACVLPLKATVLHCSLLHCSLFCMLADMFWKCYDAICFGLALAILWHHCAGMARYAMLQSKRWLLSAMRQSGRTWTKLCCKTAWAAMASMLRAAGHWQHHTASMMQPRNRTLLSRTNTTAAELFYLRHMRSCAAAPMGNKGGSPSPSTALQICCADLIGSLLQSICLA